MIILKRAAAVLVCLLLCICTFTGCTGGDKTESPEALVSQMKTYTDEDIVWVELTQSEIIGYFGFEGEIARAHTALINDSEEKYDIISAFVIPEHDDMLSAAKKVTESLDTATKNFVTANETEADKIRDRVILSRDDTLVIVVSSNAEKIKEMLLDKGFGTVA